MKLTYVSGTRADYGLMRGTLLRLNGDADVELRIVVTGMHLLPEFGLTVREIENDGFPLLDRLPVPLPDDSARTMARAFGRMVPAMADLFADRGPEVVLLLGDRDEQLAAAIAASRLDIPVAHIHGGDRSGGLDDMNRHAITRFAHLHLAACRDSADRIIRMGEEPFRVHVVGSPAVDAIARAQTISEKSADPYLVLIQHPVTSEAAEAAGQIRETLEAVRTAGLPCHAVVPNSDCGHLAIRKALEEAHRRGEIDLRVHLRREEFIRLLSQAGALVGNSSAGIIEASYLCVPAVNVGSRQSFRFRGRNVIDVPHEREQIRRAIETAVRTEFRLHAEQDRFIYGDGTAGDKIVTLLRTWDWNAPDARKKNITY